MEDRKAGTEMLLLGACTPVFFIRQLGLAQMQGSVSMGYEFLLFCVCYSQSLNFSESALCCHQNTNPDSIVM